EGAAARGPDAGPVGSWPWETGGAEMIAFTCPCGQDLLLEGDQVGDVVACPACGDDVAVPGAPFLDQAKRLCPVCGGRDWFKITSRRALKKKLPDPEVRKGDDAGGEYNTAFTFSLP